MDAEAMTIGASAWYDSKDEGTDLKGKRLLSPL
jgi:hypothetical protein